MTTHTHTPQRIGRDYGFSGPVYVHPYTDENPVAHGGICYTEECTSCGAQRDVNANAGQHEYSPWGPDRATRDRHEREERARQARAQEASDREAAQRAGVRVVEVDRDASHVRIAVAGVREVRWVPLADLRTAAQQEDATLASVYRGVLHLVEDAWWSAGAASV